MKKFNPTIQLFTVGFLGLGLILFTGCGKDGSQSSTSAPAAEHSDDDGHDHDDHAGHDHADHEGHDHAGHDHAGHDHPTEGPHHGALIELGNEAFHAELIHDEAARAVTIYLLDSAAKEAVAIDSTEILINLSHDGSAEQFVLAASSQLGDVPGKSSRFVSTEEELAEDLDLEDVKAQLVVTINGKQYRGAIHHDHDHEGHDHN